MKRTIRAPLAALVSAALAVSFAGATATAAPSGRASLAGSVPSWATSATFKSAASTSASVGFRVYLGWTNEADVQALAASVSNPRSASYGHYLTPAQFRQRFAPSQSSVNAVQSWLRSQGFRVDYTPSNNLYVAAEGTVAQAAAAFGTSFGNYAVQGQVLRSPSSAISVPASLAGIVSSVVGLDESAALVHPDATPPPVFVNAPPCSSYWGEKTTANTTTPDGTVVPDAYGAPVPYAPCGYTPPEIKSAYGLSSTGLTGAGVTVAVIDAYAIPYHTIFSDINTYSSLHGIPALSASQFSYVVAPGTMRRPENPRQSPQGWSGEETLDLEAVHGIAPGAHLTYVGAPNNYQDLDAAMNHVVNNHLGDIVTNSYGWTGEAVPAGFMKPFNDILFQAMAEGIGVYFSSGDCGDNTVGSSSCPGGLPAQPDFPASSPYVTAVGGTSIAIGAGSTYLWETGWETGKSTLKNGAWTPTPPGNYLYGSGGGTSFHFLQPSYQAGVVPTSLATANGARPAKMRVTPDVAALGDPTTGMLVGQTQTFPDGHAAYSEYRIGGTSLSSPIFAGVMALADQAAGFHHGFANPALYAAGASAFTDVTHLADKAAVRSDYVNGVDAADGYVYSLRSMDVQLTTLRTTAGYDDVTGRGTPNGVAFIDALK